MPAAAVSLLLLQRPGVAAALHCCCCCCLLLLQLGCLQQLWEGLQAQVMLLLVLSLLLLLRRLWACPQGFRRLPCQQRLQQEQWWGPCPSETGSGSLSPVAAAVVAAAVRCAHSTPRAGACVLQGRVLSAPMRLQEGSPHGCCCAGAVLAAAGGPMQRHLLLPRAAGSQQRGACLLLRKGHSCCPAATQTQAAGPAAAGGSHHQTLALCLTCHPHLCRLRGRPAAGCCQRSLCHHPHSPCLLRRTSCACPCHLHRAYPCCCWTTKQQMRTWELCLLL